MAHFAKINLVTKKVTNIIVAEQSYIDTLPDSGFWIQTSYNTHHGKYYTPQSFVDGQGYRPENLAPESEQHKALRWNFAVIGGTYDVEKDAFIPPKPFPSWILDETIMDWFAPVTYPTTPREDSYIWDEDSQSWL